MEDKKYVIFTVDTESDNQWDVKNTQSTNNSRFIPRFQELCEQYGIVPVYLIDYSMSHDDFLIQYLYQKNILNLCEIGAHIHAWDTPPKHDYDSSKNGRPYLYEYPKEMIFSKVKTLTEHLSSTFDCQILSHRAGRWAMNETYYQALNDFKYLIDCSVTPGVSWEKQIGHKQGGINYKRNTNGSYIVPKTNILEVPVTIVKTHRCQWNHGGTIRSNIINVARTVLGRDVWLRPALNSQQDITMAIESMFGGKVNYIELMMHSSEFMPGGSPYFATEEDVDNLFSTLENIFVCIQNLGYKGVSLKQYYSIAMNNTSPNKKL